MSSLHWWAFTPWMRFTCKVLHWHRWGVRISHGYAVTFCGRCWAYTIERLPEEIP